MDVKCPNAGYWRTYLDEERLSKPTRQSAKEHLADCGECQKLLRQVAEDKTAAEELMTVENPAVLPAWKPNGAAKRYDIPLIIRTAAAALVAAGLLSAIFLPPARTIAGEILQLFRAEKFAAIRIDPQAVANFDPSQLGKFNFFPPETSRVPTIEEAAKKTGLSVAEPSFLPPNLMRSGITASSAGKVSLTFDLKKFRHYLSQNNIEGINLPDSLDDSTITAHIPPSVAMQFGEGKNKPGGSQALIFAQGGLPEVEAPPGVDFDTVRGELLKLPVFPPEVRDQLANITDWKRTLPIPYPVDQVTSEKVIVADGRDGLYFESKEGDKVLIWTAAAKAYGLVAPSGSPLSRQDLFAIAKSL